MRESSPTDAGYLKVEDVSGNLAKKMFGNPALAQTRGCATQAQFDAAPFPESGGYY